MFCQCDILKFYEEDITYEEWLLWNDIKQMNIKYSANN